MLRWVLVVFLALVLIGALRPWLEKLGLGRLPGDLRFRLRGREYAFPFASAVVFSVIAGIIGWLL